MRHFFKKLAQRVQRFATGLEPLEDAPVEPSEGLPMMPPQRFWELMAGLPQEFGDECEEVLRLRLEALDADELVAFDRQFQAQQLRGFNWTLWGAASLILDGCGEEQFEAFLAGLMARGQVFFEIALADPDSLAGMLDDLAEVPNEGIAQVARHCYESLTGHEMPVQAWLARPEEPQGKDWDFDDEEQNDKRLPRLTARFGEAASKDDDDD